MSADHWIYGHARHALRGIPTQDLRCDAEDAAHDCVVQVLERFEGVEDPLALAASVMERTVRWISMAPGRKQYRRHYGRQYEAPGRPVAGMVEIDLRILGEIKNDVAGLSSAVRVFNDACQAWDRDEWPVWAWVLHKVYGWTYSECAEASGEPRSRVAHYIQRFQRFVEGERPVPLAEPEPEPEPALPPFDMKNPKRHVRAWARHVRRSRHGMTRAEAAREWGLHVNVLAGWEKGAVPKPGTDLGCISDRAVELAARAWASKRPYGKRAEAYEAYHGR